MVRTLILVFGLSAALMAADVAQADDLIADQFFGTGLYDRHPIGRRRPASVLLSRVDQSSHGTAGRSPRRLS
jgi:hypothetical protein